MKIIERIDPGEPSKSSGSQLKPRSVAIVAVLLIFAILVAGTVIEGSLSGALFGLAFGLSLYTAMIAGAFELDRRRRLNYLRGN